MCSSDPTFLGDRERYNPEELLVASLSSCHMLWYLHLAADNGIVVVDYRDDATGTMVETPDGGGKFTEVTLHPVVTARGPVDERLAAQFAPPRARPLLHREQRRVSRRVRTQIGARR